MAWGKVVANPSIALSERDWLDKHLSHVSLYRHNGFRADKFYCTLRYIFRTIGVGNVQVK